MLRRLSQQYNITLSFDFFISCPRYWESLLRFWQTYSISTYKGLLLNGVKALDIIPLINNK